jgi:hypothetical protein
MSCSRWILAFLFSFAVPVYAAPQTTTETPAEQLTNTARFLAGLNVPATSTLAPLENTLTWKSHSRSFASAWASLDRRQMSKVRTWGNLELADIRKSSSAIFYPFSGPDFLYVDAFFPQGKTYVLVGLEPVGPIPNEDKATPESLVQELSGLRSALNTVLYASFFRTNDMKVDFQERGVLPSLFVFLARTNHQLLNVEYVTLAKTGEPQVLDATEFSELPKNQVHGVRIDFTSGNPNAVRSLYYFSLDLSDSGLPENPEFTAFVQKLVKPITYLKAASYLLHNSYFSKTRNLILAQSSAILQDDSGLPLRALDPKLWDLHFYGSYKGTISLFKYKYQASLRGIYANSQNVKAINFPIGYGFAIGSSNLLLAIKK